MSAVIVRSARPTPACSYRLGVVGGSSEYPVTSAPSASSHSESQLPLKPVCPVTSTRRPRQNDGSGAPRRDLDGAASAMRRPPIAAPDLPGWAAVLQQL